MSDMIGSHGISPCLSHASLSFQYFTHLIECNAYMSIGTRNRETTGVHVQYSVIRVLNVHMKLGKCWMYNSIAGNSLLYRHCQMYGDT